MGDLRHRTPVPAQSSCLPGLIIVGMARCGTSEMRVNLADYANVDAGVKREFTHCPTDNEARRNYNASCGLAGAPALRVSATPWFFAYSTAAMRTEFLRETPPPTFVLLLRDPVERFLSSFFHVRTDKLRRAHLRVLGAWANGSLPQRRKSGWSGLYSTAASPGDAWPLLTDSGYYTLSVEATLKHVLAAVPVSNLLVGLTEELDAFVGRIACALGLSHSGRKFVLNNRKTVGGPSGHVNSNPRSIDAWVGLPAIIAAVQRHAHEHTDTAAIAATLRTTRDFPADITSRRLDCLWRTTSMMSAAACNVQRRSCSLARDTNSD